MNAPKKVDLVFVIDSSASMRPCLKGLAAHLGEILRPLQGQAMEVRFGLVASSCGKGDSGNRVYSLTTLAASWQETFDVLYKSGSSAQGDLFTSDPDQFSRRLDEVSVEGNENHLFALDCALDFPFRPVATTRRVVALFSDEKIEDGMLDEGEAELMIPKLIEKLTARRILLFGSLPGSPALDSIGSADGAQIEPVSGGDGLASVNFGKLLAQMAKTISVCSLQGDEGSYQKALYGQDTFVAGSGTFDGFR